MSTFVKLAVLFAALWGCTPSPGGREVVIAAPGARGDLCANDGDCEGALVCADEVCAGAELDSSTPSPDSGGVSGDDGGGQSTDGGGPSTDAAGQATDGGEHATDAGASGRDVIRSIAGEITWRADFPVEAEATGRRDCSYTARYRGHEDRSVPWLCPSCEAVFRVEVEVVADDDCRSQLAGMAPPSPVAWFGTAGDRGFHAGRPGYILRDVGELTVEGDVWTLDGALETMIEGQVAVTLHATARFEVGESDGDPLFGMRPPARYACGWPQAAPSPWAGGWEMAIGEVLPDGVFIDQCGEPMRLHDFRGEFLYVDVSALDCMPCQAIAEGLDDFVARMRAQGVVLRALTLMVPSIYRHEGSVDLEDIREWADLFGLQSPVLVDRGFTKSVLGAHFGSGLGFPTSLILSPELVVLEAHNGFSGWDDLEQTVRRHAAP